MEKRSGSIAEKLPPWWGFCRRCPPAKTRRWELVPLVFLALCLHEGTSSQAVSRLIAWLLPAHLSDPCCLPTYLNKPSVIWPPPVSLTDTAARALDLTAGLNAALRHFVNHASSHSRSPVSSTRRQYPEKPCRLCRGKVVRLSLRKACKRQNSGERRKQELYSV